MLTATATTTARARATSKMLIPDSGVEKVNRHYTRFLEKRWQNLSVRSAILSCILLLIPANPHDLIAFRRWRHWAFFLGIAPAVLAVYAVAMYALIELRRINLRAPRNAPKSTPLAQARALLATSRALRLVAFYSLASGVFATSHALLSSPEAKLGVFNPTPRHPWHLNERFVILFIASLRFGLIYGVLDVLQASRKRAANPWPKRKTTLYIAAIANVKSCINPVTCAPLLLAPLTVGANALTGRWFWRKVITYTGGLTRPFVINFARTNKEPIGFAFVFDLLALELLTLVAFEVPAAVFNAYARHPLDFKLFTAKGEISPDRYLLHALRSNDTYYLNFTAMELADVARSSARRKAIFGDVSNRNPTLWVDLWQTTMLLLGQSQRTLLTRNGRALPAAIVQSTVPTTAAPDAHSIMVKQDDIFRPGARAAAAAPPNKAVAYLQTAISLATSIATAISAALLPLINKRPVTVPKQVDEAVAKLHAVKPAVENEVQQLQTTVEKHFAALNRFRGLVREASGAEWAYREVDYVLANRHVDQCLFKALTSFIIGSRNEDQYGQVQRFIPATLEALARHHAALAGYKAETTAAIQTLSKGSQSWQRGAEIVFLREIETSEQQLVLSIKAITNAFGDSLAAFRFPPKIAEILISACH